MRRSAGRMPTLPETRPSPELFHAARLPPGAGAACKNGALWRFAHRLRICRAVQHQSPRSIPGSAAAAVFSVITTLVPCILVLALAGTSALAHKADTSYARVHLHAQRIELRLTFDVFALQKIVPGLDADGDLALSKAELRAATPVIEKFLRTHVGMEVNGAAADLGVAAAPFWPLDAPDPMPSKLWHANEALISFPFDKTVNVPTTSVALLFDIFGVLPARHVVLGYFEAGGKPHEVIFTASEPDYLFEHAQAATPVPAGAGPQRGNAGASPMREFLWQGALHIWMGWDHLCFLLALLVVSRLRQLVAVITSFTIAHSITLTLAAMKVISLSAIIVESAIAATIVYVAVENLVRREVRHRWLLTFAFGLIHGFGFANVLGGLELPRESFVRCLLMFNIGVEAGQLAVVLALLPFGLLIARWRHGAMVKAAVSAGVALLGLAWLADRAFQLGLMPF